MFKFLLVLILLAIGGYLAVTNIPALHQRVLEFVNPTAKQARLLNELDGNLRQLQSAVGEVAGSQTGPTKSTQINKAKNLLGRSQSLVSELQKTNSNNSGLIKNMINQIASGLFDATPYPAEDLTSSAPKTSSQIVCPSPQK